MLARLCGFVLVLMLSTSIHAATTPPLTFDALEKMVGDLGFETTSDYKTYVAIENQTAAGAAIYLKLDRTGSSLDIYVPFDDIAKNKAGGVPAIDMLEFNGSHDFTFAIRHAGGRDHLVLEKAIDASAVTLDKLRRTIASLKTAVAETRRLWKQDGWPTGAAMTYTSAIADADRIWERSPFELRNLMFVTEKPSVFGAYNRRDSNVFKAGEPILTYAEPFGYTWKRGDDGLYQFGVTMDYTLLEGEKVLGAGAKVLSYSNASKDKIREFMLNLSLDFDGLSPGKYDLQYTVHDMFSDKTAEATIPFRIAD